MTAPENLTPDPSPLHGEGRPRAELPPLDLVERGIKGVRWLPPRMAVILALGGTNLVLIEWIMVRELTALLLGTELVALFVTGSAFIGYSVGYWLSSRLSERSLRIAALI